MWVTSLYPVRKKQFELFFYTHQLYIVFVIFFALHVGDFVFSMAAGAIFLFVLDRFLRFCQSRRTVNVISATSLPCGTMEVVLSKPGSNTNNRFLSSSKRLFKLDTSLRTNNLFANKVFVVPFTQIGFGNSILVIRKCSHEVFSSYFCERNVLFSTKLAPPPPLLVLATGFLVVGVGSRKLDPKTSLKRYILLEILEYISAFFAHASSQSFEFVVIWYRRSAVQCLEFHLPPSPRTVLAAVASIQRFIKSPRREKPSRCPYQSPGGMDGEAKWENLRYFRVS